MQIAPCLGSTKLSFDDRVVCRYFFHRQRPTTQSLTKPVRPMKHSLSMPKTHSLNKAFPVEAKENFHVESSGAPPVEASEALPVEACEAFPVEAN